jgi:hypothetical protein
MVSLSQEETRVVSRLRARQRDWFRHRWYFFFSGCLISTMGVWLLYQTAERIWNSDRVAGEAVWLCPAAWYMVMQGVAMWVSALVKWRGDDVAALLLRVMDDTAAKGSFPEK